MTDKQRTLLQNRSLHKWYELMADALNDAGFDMKKTLEAIGDAEIPWSKETVKEVLWRQIQIALINKESTRDLTTAEIDEVFVVVAENIAKGTGVYVDFPHIEMPLEVYENEIIRNG